VVSLVTVAYFSATELARLISSFRRECGVAGLAGEVVVVEHSADAAERRAAAEVGPDRLLEHPNRGYGAGLNRGVAAASGDLLVLANPDVELLDGSVAAMRAAIRAGASVVGPQFTWDRDGQILHPPAEDPAPSAELRAALARSAQWLWQREMVRRVDANARVWEAEQPVAVPSLRGPLMAVDRRCWHTLDGFDERFFLYSEETDWLWRARASGARLELVPAAKAIHRWAHSTWRLPQRAELERDSQQLFRRLHYPAMWRWLLRAAERLPQRAGVAPQPVSGPGEVAVHEGDRFLLSPFRHLAPALWVPGVKVGELDTAVPDGHWVLARLDRHGSRWTTGPAYSWGSTAATSGQRG
jgi:GT2 family glycosyltransferase